MAKLPANFEPYFGSFILETLTLGMYGEARTAIREYVQNAFDSILLAIDSGDIRHSQARVDVTVDTDANYVAIRDNGAGIKLKKALETLANIGASSKDYRSQAGFRGIGRLSGLVLCDRLVFVTKAKGETRQTTVEFDAKGIRRDLGPSQASKFSLRDLLKAHITTFTSESPDVADHFFEVRMEDLRDAPLECTLVDQMVAYLAEVAPVPYSDEFEGAGQIRSAAKSRREKIEEIDVFVYDGEDDDIGTQVFKHYRDSYSVQNTEANLSEIEIIESPSKLWWGWVGKKELSGLYKEDSVRGIRVRVRNIQIDGTQVMGRIFGDIPDATSYGRFNDWYVGEIFADPNRLIPNARRDGFEELDDWITAKEELREVCRELGSDAYKLSQKTQGSLATLVKKSLKAVEQAEAVFQEIEPSITEISKIITEIDKLHRKTSRAMKGGDSVTTAQLRTVEMRLMKANKKVLSKIKPGANFASLESVTRARRELVKQLIAAFDEEFDRETFAEIMRVITAVVGDVDDL